MKDYRTDDNRTVKLSSPFPGDPHRDVWGDLWEVDRDTKVATRKEYPEDPKNPFKL